MGNSPHSEWHYRSQRRAAAISDLADAALRIRLTRCQDYEGDDVNLRIFDICRHDQFREIAVDEAPNPYRQVNEHLRVTDITVSLHKSAIAFTIMF